MPKNVLAKSVLFVDYKIRNQEHTNIFDIDLLERMVVI